ncbi:(2Fe-2S)-binding protein, partial [Streptomyces fuscigenes]|uniref:(2Fe-2S)-binding protein n=1 Tax=Streptomyces fuscigenes TaxID=1528880 RepID=UPI001F3E798D
PAAAGAPGPGDPSPGEPTAADSAFPGGDGGASGRGPGDGDDDPADPAGPAGPAAHDASAPAADSMFPADSVVHDLASAEGDPALQGARTGPADDAGEGEFGTDQVEHPSSSYVLRVNGQDRPVNDAWIGESLLYVLRERLGLAGAKDGCSQGECGACNVQVDGRLVASCLVPAATAAGSEVRTVEGLAANGEPSDVQRALAARGAVQCGFCIPGMAMTVHDLLEGNHAPSDLETRQALSGNLCRCSGYRGVLEAVREVAEARASGAEAAHAGDSANGPAAFVPGPGPAGTAERAAADGSTGPADPGRIPHQAPPGAGGVHAQAPQGPHHPHANDGGMA